MRRTCITICGVVLALILLAPAAEAQRRDHLTAEEIELVRDVRDVDLRMEVFSMAIERRLWVLNGTASLSPERIKRIEKDHDKWGDLPSGSRSELISDIEKILAESIDKLEDVFDHEPKNKLIPFALYVMADYSEKIMPVLVELARGNQNIGEVGMLESAAQHCRGILDARETIPRPTGTRKDVLKKK